MKKIAIVVGLCVGSLLSVQGQNLSFGGSVLDHDLMMPSEISSLAITQPFGTSRSMAMGGAFTSLGADMSSASINPAGLGMYLRGDVSITPMVSINKSTTANTTDWVGSTKTKFGVSNFGAAFTMFESGSSGLISLTGAISYNRLADYNTQYSFTRANIYSDGSAMAPSIADIYAQQLNQSSITAPSDGGNMDFDANPYYWNSQLGYNTFLVDPLTSGEFTPNGIGNNASVFSSMNVVSSGRADEYNFSLGGNIANKLYFGVSIGLQDIDKVDQYVYQEEYRYSDSSNGYALNGDGEVLASQFDYSNLWQEVAVSGSGYNFKFGVVARPVDALRIGVAFHTPTYYSLARSYQADIYTYLLDNVDLNKGTEYYDSTPLFVDEYENSWEFSTAPKLLTGISYQFGGNAILAIDYERAWYNGMRVQNTPSGVDYSLYDYKTFFKDNYQAVNTLRMGLEVKPTSVIAIRAGGGFSSSMIEDESLFFNAPTATTSNYFTAGLGFRLGANASLDFAYQYAKQNYTQYKLFFSQDQSTGEFVTDSGNFVTDLKRNYITATLSLRL